MIDILELIVGERIILSPTAIYMLTNLLQEANMEKFVAIAMENDKGELWFGIDLALTRFCFPGSFIEEGETPSSAAVRGIQEIMNLEVCEQDLKDIGKSIIQEKDKVLECHAFHLRYDGNKDIVLKTNTFDCFTWLSRRMIDNAILAKYTHEIWNKHLKRRSSITEEARVS